MKVLSGKSWAYLIAGAAGAFVLSAAGGAWSADELGNPSTPQPAETTPPAGPQKAKEPQKATDSVARMTESESSVAVTAIDRHERRVTLKDPAGEKYVVAVPKDVKAFDKLKVGDRIDIDYYQSVALSIAAPGTGMKPTATETMARTPVGENGEAFGKALTVSAKVVSVDPDANEVTFKGPRGEDKTVKVQDPDLQKKLPDLKAGDSVQLTYTEATAAAIRPAAADK